MVDAAADLLSRQGPAGTTVDAVLAHSAAPRGSVYHHFPGGRGELVSSAVRMVGERVAASLDAAAEAGPQEALAEFAAFWRRLLVRTDYRGGCPVVAVAVGGSDRLPAGDDLVAEVFASWHQRLAASVAATGVEPERTRRLANLTLAATQGAVVQCRVQRSTEPLDDVVTELAAVLAAAAA